MSTSIEAYHFALVLCAFALGAGFPFIPVALFGIAVGVFYYLFADFMDDMCWRRGWR